MIEKTVKEMLEIENELKARKLAANPKEEYVLGTETLRDKYLEPPYLTQPYVNLCTHGFVISQTQSILVNGKCSTHLQAVVLGVLLHIN